MPTNFVNMKTTNNSAIAIDMTLVMDITNSAFVMTIHFTKTTALFLIETAKQEHLKETF
jgi:hypothetical protein